jgi:ferrochelatase
VLLVNVGSPDEPTPAAVRRFLAEFLGDPDVVELPRVVWWPLLHGLILPLRSRKSAQLYASIWTERGSPLIDISRRQGAQLAEELGQAYRVSVAMRYGQPSIAHGLDELEASGCLRVVLVPMFPQWSRATSGSVESAVRAELARRGSRMSLAIVPAWFDDPGYIDCLAERVIESGFDSSWHLVQSFHGLPASLVERGDPYRSQCEATAAALASRLVLSRDRWSLVFQSRFGPTRWLEPYATELVPSLARTHPRVLVTCPGFAADCLETLEELDVRLREAYRAAGGERFALVPCLNDQQRWIATLARLVLSGTE